PEMPQFHRQVVECRSELEEFGKHARELDIRLSFHPSQFIVINSPDPQIAAKSVWDLESQASILDAMGCGPEAVMVIHAGGTYGDKESSRRRWVEAYRKLSEPVRRRLVLENDDTRFSAADVLAIHEETGVPLVFDNQHHWCLNPEMLGFEDTLAKFLRTWPSGVRPKIHFSSPRTEMREIVRNDKKTGKKKTVLQPPIWTGHADYNHPFEFIRFLESHPNLDCDIMLEAKAKDLALIRLRNDVLRYAPHLASRLGLATTAVPEPELEELEVVPEMLTS
ncbi:MAG TPA: UV DNA damage repair endonuclease UvsE, partial [Bryobacteraceae bacterium]|nr:UV DNA damage repair endonuclease UvsE [Bryobacteraceae bacterium]